MQDLAGKTAFVTGAASGIGLGIATAFAQAGVKVMLCDIEAEALAKAVEGLKATNADVEGVRADVSLKAELEADDRPLRQGSYPRQQCRRRRWRPLWRLDRHRMGLDDRRQPDGRRLGD
jgi:short-subunit dehydrogenase